MGLFSRLKVFGRKTISKTRRVISAIPKRTVSRAKSIFTRIKPRIKTTIFPRSISKSKKLRVKLSNYSRSSFNNKNKKSKIKYRPVVRSISKKTSGMIRGSRSTERRSIFDRIKEGARIRIKKFTGGITSITDKFRKAPSAFFNFGLGVATKSSKDVQSTFRGLYNTLGNRFTSSVKSIATTSTSIFDKIKFRTQSAIDTLKNKAAEGSALFGSGISGLFGTIKDSGSGLANKINDILFSEGEPIPEREQTFLEKIPISTVGLIGAAIVGVVLLL